MKIEKLTVRKNGRLYSGEVAWPNNLESALALLGEKEVWEAFRVGYKELAKKRITATRPRKRWLKLDLLSLDDQTLAALTQALEVAAENRARTALLHEQQRQAQESPPPAEQQTYPSDYDETQEVAEGQSSANGESFEEDFARYLTSLDS